MGTALTNVHHPHGAHRMQRLRVRVRSGARRIHRYIYFEISAIARIGILFASCLTGLVVIACAMLAWALCYFTPLRDRPGENFVLAVVFVIACSSLIVLVPFSWLVIPLSLYYISFVLFEWAMDDYHKKLLALGMKMPT